MSASAAVFPHLNGSRICRLIATVVLIAFFVQITQPVAVAFQPWTPRGLEKQNRQPSKDEQLAELLRETRDSLRTVKSGLGRGQIVAQERKILAELRRQLAVLHKEALAEFARIESLLQARGVPEVILERHRETVASYRDEIDRLQQELGAIEDAETIEQLREWVERAGQRLSDRKLERSPQPFDPAELPHGPRLPKPANKPRERVEEFRAAGFHDTPMVRLAALEGFRFDTVPGADDPAYLAEGVEARLSPTIRAKAAELEHQPVAIYHWVRNHIEWLPTWGAVQDAEVTLSSRRGNSLDIAGLLVALLRVSGVPARYVHGTIEVPEAVFRNWAGGFEHIEAAMDYAGSGGIPITGLVAGGRVSHVRLEHVWVEAAVDFLPSRGAVMREADTWLSLDAAFKQYEYTEGLDVLGISGIDGEALARQFMDSGTIDEGQGWVQGLDSAVVEAAQEQARQALEAHIESMTDPTVGDVIGGRRVILREEAVLPSGLPYQRAVEGARYAYLPAALQPRISFTLGTDLFGDPLARISFPWAQLNNRKVTLSFRPATEADEEALLALLPEGEITDISQLPSSIPAYLIQVIPELKVEGGTVLTGNRMYLGEELDFVYSVAEPGYGTRHYPNKVVAGSYLTVAVVGGSVATGSLQQAQERLEQTRELLQSADEALLAGLGREDLLGEMFHAGLLGYFAQYQVLGHLAALSGRNHFQLATSVGTFGYVPKVSYFFGIPRSISTGGIEMDLDRVMHVSSVDGKGAEAWKNFNFQLGALSSALEHAVPEQMFVTEESPGEAVSAVKALQKAAAQGQRIYHITRANQAEALPNIRQDAQTMEEIRSALAVGKEVIVHIDPIEVPGWRGAGYIITDPNTGAGAWKISGGANGGFLSNDLAGILMYIGFVTSLTGIAFGITALALFSALLAITLLINSVLDYFEAMTPESPCFGAGTALFTGLVVLPVVLAILFSPSIPLFVLTSWISFLAGGAISGVFLNSRNPICGDR